VSGAVGTWLGAVGLGSCGGDSTRVGAQGHVPGGDTCPWDVRVRGPLTAGHIQPHRCIAENTHGSAHWARTAEAQKIHGVCGADDLLAL
jgi:hypothetical protein